MCKTVSIQMTIHNPRDVRLVIKSDITDKPYRDFVRCSTPSDAFDCARNFMDYLKVKLLRGSTR